MYCFILSQIVPICGGVQWLSGIVLDSRQRGRRFEPHCSHCIVFLGQDTFILAYYWFSPCLTERLLMERKESNQTNKNLYVDSTTGHGMYV